MEFIAGLAFFSLVLYAAWAALSELPRAVMSEPATDAQLVVVDRGETALHEFAAYELTNNLEIGGSRVDAEIEIRDPTINGSLARFEWVGRNNRWSVRRLGGEGRLAVNGVAVGNAGSPLADGSRITIGTVTLKLTLGERA